MNRNAEENELFNADDANKILNFVQQNSRAEKIIIHCDMGKSRSTAVAAALSKILTGDDKLFFNSSSARMMRWIPNMRVYRTILDEYYNKNGTLV